MFVKQSVAKFLLEKGAKVKGNYCSHSFGALTNSGLSADTGAPGICIQFAE